MGAPDHDIAQAKDFIAPPGYQRHRPETTLLYQLVAEHYPAFRDRRAAEDRPLPRYVEDEFESYLKCGLLGHGFLRVKCDACQAEKLVAFSCKRRGFCPSCGARRMVETAALLVDDILPQQPVRQWVLSLPFALRYRKSANLSVCFHSKQSFTGALRRAGVGQKRTFASRISGTGLAVQNMRYERTYCRPNARIVRTKNSKYKILCCYGVLSNM